MEPRRDLIKKDSLRIDEINIRFYLALALLCVGLNPDQSLTAFTNVSPFGHSEEEIQIIIALSDRLENFIESMAIFGFDNEAKLKNKLLCENLALKLYVLNILFTDTQLEMIIRTFLNYRSNFQIFNY